MVEYYILGPKGGGIAPPPLDFFAHPLTKSRGGGALALP